MLTFSLILFLLPSVLTECILKDTNGNSLNWDSSYTLGTLKKTNLAEFSLFYDIGDVTGPMLKDPVQCGRSNFAVTSSNEKVTIATKASPDTWDSTLKGQSSPAPCDLILQVFCGLDTKTINLTILVEDVNSHDPEFSAFSADNQISLPLPAGISISKQLDLKIKATDSDFSSKISYTIEPSEKFKWSDDGEGGIDIITNAYIENQQDLTITATDGNEESKSVIKTLKLSPNLDTSQPAIPEFEHILYTSEGKEGTVVANILFQNPESFIADKLTVSSNNDIFSANIQPSPLAVVVTMIGDIPDDKQSVFVHVTVTNKYTNAEETGEAIIYVTFDGSTPTKASSPITTDTTHKTTGDDNGLITDKPDGVATECSDCNEDTLMITTIVFAVFSALLIFVTGYGYIKYVRGSSSSSSSHFNVAPNEESGFRSIKTSVTTTENGNGE